jgi:hypothetical protein
MLGLILCIIISMSFLPKAPKGYGRFGKTFMILQWLMVPITVIIFGAFPAIEAQTRLMFAKYMGFWVTTKYRK